MLGHDPSRSRGRWLAVILLVLAGVLIGVLHNRYAGAGRADPITGVVRTVVGPLVATAGGISAWFGRQTGWIWRGRALAEENRLLRSEVAALREEASRLREASITARRLEAQIGFRSAPPARKLPARVLSLRPTRYFETAVIDRGARDGVKPGSVVVVPDGVVGSVYDVAATTSAVLLLTDSNAAIGALVQRADSRVAGICRGDGSDYLSMIYLNRDANVRRGDTIMSSGLGGEMAVYPKGLVVGTVISVADDPSGASKVVRVLPAAEFGQLEEVFVLK